MDTKEVEVKLSEPLLEKIYKSATPYQSIAELVWNALDADADRVEVVFERNGLSGFDTIIIEDNGHGIPYDEFEIDFGFLGKSPKLTKEKSPKGRFFHGKNGSGRYMAYALGTSVEWISTYKDNVSALDTFSITGDASVGVKKFKCTKLAKPQEKTGVKVRLTNLRKKAKEIDIEELRKELTAQLAFYVKAYTAENITLVIDGEELDVKAGILSEKTEKFEVKEELPGGRVVEADFTLSMYHWKDAGIRKRFFCGARGDVLLEDAKTGIPPKKNFGHSIYISSSYLDKLAEENTVGLLYIDEIYPSLEEKIKERVGKFHLGILSDRVQGKLQQIKKSKNYPYQEPATTPMEEAKRQIYDIYLAEMLESPKNPLGTGGTSTDAVILHLLKDAMEKNPSSLIQILHELLNLANDEIEELAHLLDNHSFSNLIKSSRLVLDRLNFIEDLEHILFDKKAKKIVLERTHLHKILENETWIFGDHYELGNSDNSLKNVLRTHLAELGKDVAIADDVPLEGQHKVLDIVLSKQFQRDAEKRDYLIVELKRPGAELGEKEFAQIRKYARLVSQDERFDKEKCSWTFILIGNTIAPEIEDFTKGSPKGKVLSGTEKELNYDLWVVTWAELLHPIKCKYQFIKEKLDTFNENPEDIKYLRSHYEKFLPKKLLQMKEAEEKK